VKAYEEKSLHDIYEWKWQNWITAADQSLRYWQQVLKFATAIGSRDLDSINRAAIGLRLFQFFYFVPSLGFLGLGVPALLLGILPRFRTACWRYAMMLWTFIFVVTVIWCLLMFGPATTVIHQGTYATVLLALAGCVFSLWSVSPWLAKIAVALQGVLNFLLYGPFMQKKISENLYVTFGDVHLGLLITAALAALAVVWLLYKAARPAAAH
jgi:hypothetical protein